MGFATCFRYMIRRSCFIGKQKGTSQIFVPNPATAPDALRTP